MKPEPQGGGTVQFEIKNATEAEVRREQARELEASFVKRELELAQQNLPGGRYADLYESFGNDERLRTLAPETALKYLDTAKRLRAAEKHHQCSGYCTPRCSGSRCLRRK